MGRRAFILASVLACSCAEAPARSVDAVDRQMLVPRIAAERFCPQQRVVVTPKPGFELRPPTCAFKHEELPATQPPADVAADRERLAIWRARDDEARRNRREAEEKTMDALLSGYRKLDLYEVTGCGAPTYFACAAEGRFDARSCSAVDTFAKCGGQPVIAAKGTPEVTPNGTTVQN